MSTTETDQPAPAPIERSHTRFIRKAMIETVAVAAALGSQEFVAGLITPLPSLMSGTATWFIDVAPGWLTEWAIGNFEELTRPILILGIVAVLILGGLITSGFTWWIRRTLFTLVGAIGALVTAQTGAELIPAAITALVAVLVGIGTDYWLRRQSSSLRGRREVIVDAEGHQVAIGASRRVFLVSVGAIAAVAVAAALSGRRLIEESIRRLARREDVILPDPVSTVQPVTTAHQFDIEGLPPVVTPNAQFFTVDITALAPPEIDLLQWTLTVDGMVDTPLTLTYEDILDMDLVEQYATLACVSNRVGGRLIGNAKWLGVPLPEILEMAGARPTAEQVAAFGADGFSTGFPLAAVYDRNTILAVGMNGEPLPYKHGFPARLVVPGYYGFVSAAKWIEKITLTGWDDHDAYWVKLGWAKNAPVVTQSRIDAPRDGTDFPAGARMIAGVAWATFHGIDRVEVKVDDGPWRDAQVSEPLGGAATWVQWRLPWNPAPGAHTIAVRATDGTGTVQVADTRPPIPYGATGHHTVRVTAT